jgi:replicative DNA helicase
MLNSRAALERRDAAVDKARMATLATLPTAPADAAPRLPQNVEAEAALLGAMMIDNRLADDIVEVIQDQHFFEPVHGRIFKAIKTLRKNDMLATPVTLKPLFEKDEGMATLGGRHIWPSSPDRARG